MSYSTLFGILCGFLIIAFAIFFSKSDFLAYLDLNSFFIVIGGTTCATIASFPRKELKNIGSCLRMAFLKESVDTKSDMKELITIGKLWFKSDLKAVENELTTIKNEYLVTGINLVIDGSKLDDILQLLHWRILRLKKYEASQANIFKSMASYAPAFGMMGTIIGLVNMMQNMTGKNIEEIGTNMSIALITTFYGIVLANLIFKPIALKLERRTEKRVAVMRMILEGIILISQKRSPSFIRETLKSFIIHYPDELSNSTRKQLHDDIN